MLKFAPSQRPTTSQIMKNKLFKDFNKSLGYTVNTNILPPKYCNLTNYYAFDMLVRISSNLPITLETFFLAADMYNRALVYAEPYINLQENFKNLVYIAMTSLYMAIKLIESFSISPEKITKLTQNKYFTSNSILRGESLLTTQWNGVTYPENLYNVSTTFRRLEFAFNLAKNCKIYKNIDLDKWDKSDKIEAKSEGVFDKNIQFNQFLSGTQYYKDLKEDNKNYIQKIYNKDQK